MSNILPTLKGLVDDIREFTKGPLLEIGNNINQGLGENREAIRSIVANMERITGDVQTITSGADADLRQILADVREITGSVKDLVGNKPVGDDVRDSVGKLNAAVNKLDRALGNVEEITAGLQDGKGNLGRILKDDALMDEVEEVVHDVGGLVKSVSSLQTVVGLRTEYNFQAGTLKTYVSVELRPRPDKYYLIELIDDPRGRRDVRTTITSSTDPSKPLLTREDTVVLSDAFRFSFQFAKRIRFPVLDTTFRFGIKESTGGVGLDLHFMDDQIQITSDLFDFQANLFPRLKIVAVWQFFKRIYVVGGIDDVFNDRPMEGTGGGRDYFLGMQLRFTDEDLLQLLMFGGSAIGGASGG